MQLIAIERIRLLIHIVRELHTSHGITVETLKVADRPIRDQIRPKSRLRFLEEIYDIRGAEERLLSRQTGNVLLTPLSFIRLIFSIKTGNQSNSRYIWTFYTMRQGLVVLLDPQGALTMTATAPNPRALWLATGLMILISTSLSLLSPIVGHCGMSPHARVKTAKIMGDYWPTLVNLLFLSTFNTQGGSPASLRYHRLREDLITHLNFRIGMKVPMLSLKGKDTTPPTLFRLLGYYERHTLWREFRTTYSKSWYISAELNKWCWDKRQWKHLVRTRHLTYKLDHSKREYSWLGVQTSSRSEQYLACLLWNIYWFIIMCKVGLWNRDVEAIEPLLHLHL